MTSPAADTAPVPQISGLAALAPRYDALFCDVWGVLIDGRSHFPAAAAALERYRAEGGKVVLITNASRPSQEVRGQLDRLGLPRAAYDDLVSAGELTMLGMVSRPGQTCFQLGPPRDNGLFEAARRLMGGELRLVPLEEADYVVCTGLVDERRETPDDYGPTLAAMKARDLTMLCANPDIVVGVGGELVWCAGALAERYAALGGKVAMAGKPHPEIYTAAFESLARLAGGAVDRSRVLAVGDGVATDLVGAARAGLDSLFLLDGVHREELFPGPEGRLDHAALGELFARAHVKPVAMTSILVW
ncbi:MULTISPECIES: TIGR01459 family HAD-type hydrolase [Methylosinus]|uniref:TIGR01459 family HAD-type hydrolase n=1 Tax=Methylosinus trichosporium (strain ATCC 35070 / NCIMB 11131 / UNIQEM 75 / OB3b) TaxID=595536 RepID=A0A2D2D0Z3_METT3|nr:MULTISPECIES: TIGR01459 family HAD-type hydrolase [Methylosinus]ATQ68671.1 TIGR01459 family HAD-type hydrolase [Methylosinus trichosporium OB3b]OBS53165.1 haloacid dehalogenase [Methylosinus sp. 3S-1]